MAVWHLGRSVRSSLWTVAYDQFLNIEQYISHILYIVCAGFVGMYGRLREIYDKERILCILPFFQPM